MNVASATSIVCTSPAHVAGTVDVVVTNADTQSSTLTASYTYEAGPTLTAVSPPAGALGGGNTLTLTGTGFLPGATVLIGAVACNSITVASSTQNQLCGPC